MMSKGSKHIAVTRYKLFGVTLLKKIKVSTPVLIQGAVFCEKHRRYHFDASCPDCVTELGEEFQCRARKIIQKSR